jgi:addiction module HigA family antidote
MAKKKKTKERALKLPNVHPGEVLLEEFLEPLGISQYRLAKDICVPQTRIAAIIKGERAISTDTAFRLARYFGTTAKFWINLQAAYDLEEFERHNKGELAKIKRCECLEEHRIPA